MAEVIVAITNIRPNADVKVVNNDINKITWLDSNPTNITTEQIQAEMNRMDDKISNPDNYAYINKRQKEYPSIEEQLDTLWHDINNDKLNKNGNFYKLLNDIKTMYAKSQLMVIGEAITFSSSSETKLVAVEFGIRQFVAS